MGTVNTISALWVLVSDGSVFLARVAAIIACLGGRERSERWSEDVFLFLNCLVFVCELYVHNFHTTRAKELWSGPMGLMKRLSYSIALCNLFLMTHTHTRTIDISSRGCLSQMLDPKGTSVLERSHLLCCYTGIRLSTWGKKTIEHSSSFSWPIQVLLTRADDCLPSRPHLPCCTLLRFEKNVTAMLLKNARETQTYQFVIKSKDGPSQIMVRPHTRSLPFLRS